jgi:sensor histidine kinase regulating citrate/malate metabolism
MRENKFSDSLTIIFSNNGIPLPKGMAEAYSIRGEKAGDKANEGIGSWQVYQIVKEHFKGDIKIIDSPSEDFPVKIEIKLPIVGLTEIK